MSVADSPFGKGDDAEITGEGPNRRGRAGPRQTSQHSYACFDYGFHATLAGIVAEMPRTAHRCIDQSDVLLEERSGLRGIPDFADALVAERWKMAGLFTDVHQGHRPERLPGMVGQRDNGRLPKVYNIQMDPRITMSRLLGGSRPALEDEAVEESLKKYPTRRAKSRCRKAVDE